MDAFSLAFSYGIKGIHLKKIVITAITVGLFHFFMPLLGNYLGVSLFSYTILKPKFIMFFVFFLLSLDMITHFFDDKEKIRKLDIFGTLLFATSVSFDSFSVGLGLSYLSDSIILSCFTFCLISSFFTLLGFEFGKKLSEKIGRYSFLLGGVILLFYSVWILTK